jgi:acetyl esterase/lipase
MIWRVRAAQAGREKAGTRNTKGGRRDHASLHFLLNAPIESSLSCKRPGRPVRSPVSPFPFPCTLTQPPASSRPVSPILHPPSPFQIERLQSKLQAAGVRVDLPYIGEGMPHVFAIFATLSWGANSPLPPALVPLQIERLQSKLKESGVKVDPPYIGEGMPHVFPIFATLSWGANTLLTPCPSSPLD